MKTDGRGMRTRSDHEVELGLALRAVEGEVHAGINVLVRDASVVWHIRMPFVGVIAQEVVALSRQQVAGGYLSSRVSAGELHAHHGGVVGSRVALLILFGCD